MALLQFFVKFSEVEKGVGARKFGNSVEWLRDSSMADMAHNLTAPLFPLAAYEDESAFKLYLSDIGLLTALYGFDMKAAVVDGTLNRLLARDDIATGYKLTGGNVGVAGKKVTLPHYMAMFL